MTDLDKKKMRIINRLRLRFGDYVDPTNQHITLRQAEKECAFFFSFLSFHHIHRLWPRVCNASHTDTHPNPTIEEKRGEGAKNKKPRRVLRVEFITSDLSLSSSPFIQQEKEDRTRGIKFKHSSPCDADDSVCTRSSYCTQLHAAMQ